MFHSGHLQLTFAVDFSVFLGLGGRLQALAAFRTAEAVLMPRLKRETKNYEKQRISHEFATLYCFFSTYIAVIHCHTVQSDFL